jgi:hypothetical protein
MSGLRRFGRSQACAGQASHLHGGDIVLRGEPLLRGIDEVVVGRYVQPKRV